MKVVVTGGSGRLGQHTIRELLAHEHQVLSLDKAPPPERLCSSWQVDLTGAGSAHEALKGVDAVIQLGAFQAPNMTSNAETFNNNVSIAFNVFQAAADMGVKRVVFASSIAAYGFIYAPQMWAPDFLPFDESHPCRPQDPYGLSKVVGERIADYFVGQSDMTAASLRITGINFDPTYEGFREVLEESSAKGPHPLDLRGRQRRRNGVPAGGGGQHTRPRGIQYCRAHQPRAR